MTGFFLQRSSASPSDRDKYRHRSRSPQEVNDVSKKRKTGANEEEDKNVGRKHLTVNLSQNQSIRFVQA